MSPTRRRARALYRRLVAAAAMAIVSGSLAGLPQAQASPRVPGDHHLPHAPAAALVHATALALGRAPAPQAGVVTSVPAPKWPAAGAADVDLQTPAAGNAPTATGGVGVALATAAGLPLQVGSPIASRSHVRVLDHSAAQRAGVTGFLFQVSRADGGSQPAPMTSRLDYSGFAQAYGGGFASRLTVMALLACAATTPQLSACQLATPVPTTNDLATHTLTAQLNAQPAPGAVTTAASSEVVFAVTSTTSGGSGDYKATSLSPSATWDVGLQTGDFTWNYPLHAPPPIGGAGPSLALAYNSGTSDGETAQTNAQTSQVGEGFQLAGGGFVERRYKSCADEITTPTDKTGDLCWGGDNAYLAMDGRATQVVKDDGSGIWRLKNDDGSRVELLMGASNGANQGEYWRVTTSDGTQYFFGKNQLPGYASGDQTTNSVWTVPVVGRNSGEPCHGSTYDSSMCYQAWRWNLDLTVDPHGNATEYFYTPETNYYLFDSTGGNPGTAKQYTRGGYLNQVGYSSRSDNVYAHIPTRIQLAYGERGMDRDHLPDGSHRSVTVGDSQGNSTTDSERLNGLTRERIAYNGPGGAEVSGTITDPWQSSPTASNVKSWGTLTAELMGVAAVHDRIDLTGGGVRRTEVDNTFNGQGLITQTSDLGDLRTASDDLCIVNTYAQDTAAWMLDYVSERSVHAGACGSTGALMADTRHMLDGGAFGAAPSHGDVTGVDEWSAGDPGVADHWVAATRDNYDSYGHLTSSRDAAGNNTRITYSSAYGTGEAITQVVATNPLGWTSTNDSDPARGLPVDSIDPNGQRADFTYDPLGRLTAVWEPGQTKASGAKPNVTFAYQVRNTAPAAVTTNRLINPNGLSVTKVDLYDGLMRPRQTQQVAEAVNGAMLVSDTLYDSRGEAVTQNNAYTVSGSPSASLVRVSQSQVPSYIVTTYDGAGRRMANALYTMGNFVSQTSYSYGGDRATVAPPNGGTVTTTVTDARNRTTELDQYHGSTPAGAFDSTTYSYTPAGQQATMTDAGGNTWSRAYDLLGRRVQSADPDTGTTTSVYDDLGRLTSTTDARGKTTSITYDALGRKTAEYDTTGGAPENSSNQLAALTYDTVSGARGQLASATRYSNGSAYTEAVTAYDSAYRPISTQITIPGSEGALAGTYSFAATYNVDRSLATESFPGGGSLPAETVHHTYDDLGQPDSTWGASDYVERTLWTPDMLPATYYLGLNPNAQWSAVNMSYEVPTRRPSETTVQRESNGWASDADFRYAYDSVGNVKSASETVVGDYQCFTYDYLRRLTQAWAQPASGCSTSPTPSTIGGPSPYLEQLSYDASGNRTADNIAYGPGNYVDYPGNGYPAAGSRQPHTLTSQQVVTSAYGAWTDTRTYDASGNTLSISTPHSSQVLRWDARGDLASVVDGVNGHTTTYVYDAAGSLLLRHDDASATLYLPGEELMASGSTVTGTRYYAHNGATVAVRTASGVGWLAADPHGSATVLIDASSQAVSQRRFLPFGALGWPFPASWPGDHGFVGGTTDSTTGFTNLGARQYDPVTGRFLSADPVLETGDPAQINGYGYAANNPVTFADPTGLMFPAMAGGGSCTGSSCRPGGGPRSYYDAVYWNYFIAQPPNSQRTSTWVRPEANYGIILVRTFIQSPTAAFSQLHGDERGFKVNPVASYRMAFAYDTATGQIVTTISPSRTTYMFGQQPIACPGHGGVCGYRRYTNIIPALPIVSGGANHVYAKLVGETLTIDYSGLNSLLPCCSVNGTIRIHVDSSGSTVHFVGDAYPSIEINQYRRGHAPAVLFQNAQADGGLSAVPFVHQATRTWVDGTPVQSSDSGIGIWMGALRNWLDEFGRGGIPYGYSG